MLVVLPLVTFVALILIIRTLGKTWSASFLIASLLWGCLVVGITECLSVPKLITPLSISIAWSIAAAVAVFGFYAMRKKTKRALQFSKPELSVVEWAFLSALGLIVVLSCIVALVSPPNSWDSMTYHMSRVMHWVQNRSVDFYATGIRRQLHSPPWSGYAILQLQELSGNDYFDNLIQVFALVGVGISCGAIAAQLGASRKGQLIAAIVAMTNQIAVLEAASTLNDLIAAYWVTCSLFFLLEYSRETDYLTALWFGLSVSLAVATKVAPLFFILPLGLWFGFLIVRKKQLDIVLKSGIIIGFCVLALNGAHWARNYQLCGSIFGPSAEDRPYGQLAVVHVTPLNVISGFAKDLATDATTPFDGLNNAIVAAVCALHQTLGLDPNDPATTFFHDRFRLDSRLAEACTGCPLHAILAWAVVSFYLFKKKQPANTKIISICLIAAYVLMAAALIWTPYTCRLRLPFFILSAPLVGLWIDCATIPFFALGLILLTAAIVDIFANGHRPFLIATQLPRERQFLVVHPEIYPTIGKFLADHHYKNIGLIGGWATCEYPLWIFTEPIEGRRLEYVYVDNPSARLADPAFVPDVIVEIKDDANFSTVQLPADFIQTHRLLGHLQLLINNKEAPFEINVYGPLAKPPGQ